MYVPVLTITIYLSSVHRIRTNSFTVIIYCRLLNLINEPINKSKKDVPNLGVETVDKQKIYFELAEIN